MNKAARFFAYLCLAVMIGITAAYAEEPAPPEQEAAPATEIIDFSKSEGTGLYEIASEGSLGRDLYDGMPRAIVMRLLENAPESSRSTGVQKLIHGALLTTVETKGITSETPASSGQDLLTVRMQKLLQTGAYKQAFALYSKLEDDPYHEELGKAGILAMIHTEGKSLACLETNTLKDRFASSDFFTTMSAYCDATLSDSPEETIPAALQDPGNTVLKKLATKNDYVFSYEATAFNQLSQLEQALIAAENKLDVSSIHGDIIGTIPPAHINIVLGQDALGEKERLHLMARAVEYGLAGPQDLADLYKITASPAAGSASTHGQAHWETLPSLYQQALNSSEDEERRQIVKNVLKLEKEYGPNALTPFAEMLAQNSPNEDTTLEETTAAYKIMYRANIAIPHAWTEHLHNFSVENSDKETLFQVLTAAYISQTKSNKNKNLHSKMEEVGRFISPETQKSAKYIIENLDKAVPDKDNAVKIYEKEFDLTFKNDYVMPSIRVWDRLLQASQSNSIGETVLLSAIVLNDTPLQDIYPGLFQDVLTSLNTVGLTHISRDLALAKILEV